MIPCTLAPLPAEQAVLTLAKHLAMVMRENEQGVLQRDADSLHDYRVAIRKIRVLLKQCHSVLPASDEFNPFFYYLGQLSGSCRDLDVYLESFTQDRLLLPLSDSQPLAQLLQEKKNQAYQTLIQYLISPAYLAQCNAWQVYLTNEALFPPYIIKQLIQQRTNKLIKRILTAGSRIYKKTNAEQWHELRKTCKKLRYLLEFFAEFYHEEKQIQLIVHLKKMQDILGMIQDVYYQQNLLQNCAIKLNDNTTVSFFLEQIKQRQVIARAEFKPRFAEFEMIAKNGID